MVQDTATGRPRRFIVWPWMARVLWDIFPLVRLADGSWERREVPFDLVVYSSLKKSGKTALNGAVCAYMAFEFASPGAELLLLANTKEQSADRVYRAVRYAIENNHALRQRCRSVLETSIRLRNGTTIKVAASKNTSIAGPNQVYSGWTELWGFDGEDDKRAWSEMTPPPTVPSSFRFVDTYAGYEGESELLNGLEDAIKAAPRRYLKGYTTPPGYDVPAPSFDEDGSLIDDWQPDRMLDDGRGFYDDPLPVFADETSGLYGLWDEGKAARRAPWQRGTKGNAYYVRQKKERIEDYTRLHENRRAPRGGVFVSADEWDACADPALIAKPVTTGRFAFAVDVGLKHDHAALVGVSLGDDGIPEARIVREWEPSERREDGVLIIDPKVIATDLLELRRQGVRVDVMGYDPFQFESLARDLARHKIVTFEFNQGQLRLLADTDLRNRIRQRTIRHAGDEQLTRSVRAANARGHRNDGSAETSRVRIVKGAGFVDVAVALSMATHLATHPEDWQERAQKNPIPEALDVWALGVALPGLSGDARERRGPRERPSGFDDLYG